MATRRFIENLPEHKHDQKSPLTDNISPTPHPEPEANDTPSPESSRPTINPSQKSSSAKKQASQQQGQDKEIQVKESKQDKTTPRKQSLPKKETNTRSEADSGVGKKIAVAVHNSQQLNKKHRDNDHHKSGSAVAKQKEDEDRMEFWPVVIGILILAGFIAALAWVNTSSQNPTSPPPGKSAPGYEKFGYDPKELQTFTDLYEQIKKIDTDYVTDYHEERLGQDMINPQFIPPYIERIDALSEAVNASESNETDIMNAFIVARRRMLISEGNFHEALKFGRRGVVSQTFNCNQKKDVLKASELYNLSFEIGRLAVPRFDEVLRKSGDARQLLGLNTKKPRWYVTKFGDIKQLVDTNIWAINVLCNKQNLNMTSAQVKQVLNNQSRISSEGISITYE